MRHCKIACPVVRIARVVNIIASVIVIGWVIVIALGIVARRNSPEC